jgi:hypothetical protein
VYNSGNHTFLFSVVKVGVLLKREVPTVEVADSIHYESGNTRLCGVDVLSECVLS